MSSLYDDELLLSSQETLTLMDTLVARMHADMTAQNHAIIGIRRGGALLAQHLWQQLCQRSEQTCPIGFLDITFYRDDLDTIGPNPVVGPTDLTMDIDDKRILLVDDILFTGRTIRAAMNALFDYGRPESVDLLVLVDRGGRQLPIQPNYTGLTVQAGERESIKLLGKGTEMQVVRRKLRG